jgi:ribosomal protein S27AE
MENLSLPLSTPANPKVLKRECSDCGNHVLMPDAVEKLTTGKIQAMLKETSWKWMLQDYVEHLRQIGEWRVYMLNGKALHAVCTTHMNGRWSYDYAYAFMTLDEMR